MIFLRELKVFKYLACAVCVSTNDIGGITTSSLVSQALLLCLILTPFFFLICSRFTLPHYYNNWG